GLDVVVERRVTDVAIERTDDATTDRSAKAERIADRQYVISHAYRVAVTEPKRGQWSIRCHLDKRDVNLVGLGQQRGTEQRVVLQRYEDVRRTFDDVPIGHDDAAWIDDEAGAEKAAATRRARAGGTFRCARHAGLCRSGDRNRRAHDRYADDRRQ